MQAVTRHAAVTNYASTAGPSPTPTLFGVSLTKGGYPPGTDRLSASGGPGGEMANARSAGVLAFIENASHVREAYYRDKVAAAFGRWLNRAVQGASASN